VLEEELGVVVAAGMVGRMGIAAAARSLSLRGRCGKAIGFTVGRILNAVVACCPARTVTLSSLNPIAGCQARTRYLPGGMASMVNVPFAAVCA
jgi:hypothetical protein